MLRIVLKALLYKLGIFSKRDLVRAYRFGYSRGQRATPFHHVPGDTAGSFVDGQRQNFRVQ
jgi:hypothetical protein